MLNLKTTANINIKGQLQIFILSLKENNLSGVWGELRKLVNKNILINNKAYTIQGFETYLNTPDKIAIRVKQLKFKQH